MDIDSALNNFTKTTKSPTKVNFKYQCDLHLK